MISNYIVDVIIIAVLLLFVFIFAHKGFFGGMLRSFSWLISIVATYMLYPILSSIIRKTFIFEFLKDYVYKSAGLDSMTVTSGAGQIDAINSLSLPETLKTMLIDNNNSVIYDLLGVEKLQEYVAGYIANIIINVVTGILVFVVLCILIKVAIGALKLAVKLPVVKQIDGVLGGFMGLVWGVVAIWAVMSLTTLFIASPVFSTIITAIDNSILGSILYNNNLIMNVLLAKLFGWG